MVSEEAKRRAEEAARAAEVQRRTAEGQHKPSIVIPVGGSLCRSTSGLSSGVRAPCDRGEWRPRRMKEDDGEDDKEDDEDNGERDFMVLLALMQEHRDTLGALMMTLSTLLKEFRGYRHKQWDLHTCQVKGLKALQREMRKANTLKVKELEATTKGKEKAAEVPEELSESSKEEEETEDSHEGGVAKGKDEDRDGDVDVEMGAVPSASAT
ncbi:hypothetical protein ID866_13110 [Astraeus odoratus]|nr:hypothetical protein ID866_13110 [Astraeus odoratus]